MNTALHAVTSSDGTGSPCPPWCEVNHVRARTALHMLSAYLDASCQGVVDHNVVVDMTTVSLIASSSWVKPGIWVMWTGGTCEYSLFDAVAAAGLFDRLGHPVLAAKIREYIAVAKDAAPPAHRPAGDTL